MVVFPRERYVVVLCRGCCTHGVSFHLFENFTVYLGRVGRIGYASICMA